MLTCDLLVCPKGPLMEELFDCLTWLINDQLHLLRSHLRWGHSNWFHMVAKAASTCAKSGAHNLKT